MNFIKKYRFYIFVVLLLSPLTAVYLYLIRPAIAPAYFGQAPEWMEHIIQTFYPRFETEKHRFPVEFFIEKADNCVFRAFFVVVLFCIIKFVYDYSRSLRSEIEHYWKTTAKPEKLSVLRVVFYLMSFTIFYDWYEQLNALGSISRLYKPVLLLDIFNIPYPSSDTILILHLLLGTSAILVVFNRWALPASVIFAFLFVLFQGYLFSFEKIDHGYAIFTYVAMLFPFVIYEEQKSKLRRTKRVSSWPLQLIKLVICMCYMMSGLEKLFVSGITWPISGTLQAYLLHHHTLSGLIVASYNGLATSLAIFTLLFQLGFMLILVFPHRKWLFLSAGILFHSGVVLLFGFSAYWNPWVMCYIFFLDASPVFDYWEKRNRLRRLRAVHAKRLMSAI